MSEHIEEAKVEVFKVWYSLFCVLMDDWIDGKVSSAEVLEKLRRLRNTLVTRLPEVEAHMLEYRKEHGL